MLVTRLGDSSLLRGPAAVSHIFLRWVYCPTLQLTQARDKVVWGL